ncbi:MAG: complex I subunit 5 family protein [Desulfobulbales bacterium]|nr:complex I subunit 5 family protein [Desulfobulbales bacterium]
MMSQFLNNGQPGVLLLSMVPGLPLLVAFALLFRATRRSGLKLAPWTALPALAAALLLQPGIDLEVAWFFMGGRMGIDPVGRYFLLLAALVWGLSAWFGRGYLRDDPEQHRFFFFYLLTMAFNFGLILARDMLGFYLFFGMMSIVAYGLIVHKRSPEALQAGRVYITLVMAGEVLLFAGMVLMASSLPDLGLSTIAASRTGNLSLILLFVGFGIKAGLLPLHVWLPLAHPVAPVPASAVLSGVMIKAGLLGWLRFLPMGEEIVLPGWGGVLIVMGLVAAFYGVAIGLAQREAKTILAYSSISQMGLMTALVGCGLLAPNHWPQVIMAVGIYALHHGLAKGSLFLATGLGMARSPGGAPPRLLLLLFLPALALAGLPLTSGAIAKYAMKEIVHALPGPWPGILGFSLPLTALATTLIVCHFLKTMATALPRRSINTRGMTTSWFTLWAGVALLPWFWPEPPPYAAHLADMQLLRQGLWPILAGVIMMAAYWRWWPAAKRPTVPAGDVLWLVWPRPTPAEKATPQAKGMISAEPESGRRARQLLASFSRRGQHLEKRLMRWSVAGAAYLLLCLFFLVMLHA